MKAWQWTTLLLSTIVCYSDATEQQRQSNSVVACGGFVRWGALEGSSGKQINGVTVDYSELRLNVILESSKTLVDITDILPNGAFSLPVYSEDVYRLVLATPDGWYISPSEGHLLDLRKNSDICSTTDFNFHLHGFTVYGQVITHGLTMGPTGLHVYLLSDGTTSENGQNLYLANVTTSGGNFVLAPVLPGDYTLAFTDKKIASASAGVDHSFRARRSVHVDAESLHIPDPIVLLGHYLRGSVTDFTGKPCSGCLVWLLAHSANLTAVGCGVQSTADSVGDLSLWSELNKDNRSACQTRTDAHGYFSFERLPGGRYYLLPDHHIVIGDSSTNQPMKKANYTFQPKFLAVDMEHTDLDLTVSKQSTFTTSGLTLPAGRILWPNGKPILGAKVSVVETGHQFLSDSDGFFQPGSVQPGPFTISVDISSAQFDPVRFNPLTSVISSWPEIRPQRLSVCGRFTHLETQDFPAALRHQSLVAKVVFTAPDNSTTVDQIVVQAEHRKDGELGFCTYLPLGQFVVTPDVALVSKVGVEHHVSLPFIPSSTRLSLFDGPEHLLFTQFRANLTGRLVCLLQSCDRHLIPTGQTLALKLNRVHHNLDRAGQVELDAPLSHPLIVDISLVAASSVDQPTEVGSAFEFVVNSISPGDYEVELVLHQSGTPDILSLDGWCWGSSAARLLHVGDQNVSWRTEHGLLFHQVGYVVHVNTVTTRSTLEERLVVSHGRHPQTIGWLRLVDSSTATPKVGQNKQQSNKSSPRKPQVFLWRVTEGRSQICVPLPRDRQTDYDISVSSTCVGLQLQQPYAERINLVKDSRPVLSNAPQILITIAKLPITISFTYPSSLNWSTLSASVKEPINIELIATTSITPKPGEGEAEQHQETTTTLLSATWSTEGANLSASLNHSLDVSQPFTTPLANQDVVITTHLLAQPKQTVNRVRGQTPSRWHFVHLVDPNLKEEATLTSSITVNERQSAITVPPSLALQDVGAEYTSTVCNSSLSWLPMLQFPLQFGVVLRGQIIPAVENVKVNLRWKETPHHQKRANAGLDRGSRDPEPSSARQPRLLPIHVAVDQVDVETRQSDNTHEHINATVPESLPYTCLSDPNGVFYFEPIVLQSSLAEFTDPASLFVVTLDKPGFEFVSIPPSPSNNWLFEGMKLSLVEVLVLTEDRQFPLSGVLVSIIGQSHRENMLTNDGGLVQFVGLAQGQYYIRPMMKEFMFTVTRISPSPKSKGTTTTTSSHQSAIPIQVVAGGPDVSVKIAARRTAFSLLGQVISLARHPLANIVVEARWLPEPPSDSLLKLDESNSADQVPCQLPAGTSPHLTVPREQAVTDGDGVFRLRGLLPGCFYAIHVQQNFNGRAVVVEHTPNGRHQLESHQGFTIDRVIPQVIHIKMPSQDTGSVPANNSDYNGLVFCAVHSLHLTTLTASVDVPDRFRDSLYLLLFRADRPDVVVARHDFATDSLLFSLSGPTVSGMADKDYIMRLESSLSSAAYTGVSRQDKAIRMRPGVSEHVRFTFLPVLRQRYSDNNPRNTFPRTQEL